MDRRIPENRTESGEKAASRGKPGGGFGWALILGGCYAAANLLGGMLEEDGYLSAPSAAQMMTALLQWILFTGIICLIWAALDGKLCGRLHARSGGRDSSRGASAADADCRCVSADTVQGNGGYSGSSTDAARRDKMPENGEPRGRLRARFSAAGAAWDALSPRKRNFILWLVMMAADLVSLLAVYPGFFVYDAAEELAMVQTRSFTTHHPLLHVLLMGGVIQAVHQVTDSYNVAIFVWLLLQMAVILAVFTYMLADLRRRGSGRGLRIFSLLWLVLCPTVTMFVLCSCKDGLFAASLLLMTIELRRLAEGSRGRHIAAFILAAAAMMLLRNNGVYAYAVFLAISAAAGIVRLFHRHLLRRHASHVPGVRSVGGSGDNAAAVSADGKTAGPEVDDNPRGERPDGTPRFTRGSGAKGLAVLLAPLVLYLAASGALTAATDADTSESQEILTVPIMQLARTWNSDPDSFTPEDRELMDALMEEGGWEMYNPKLSDQVKVRFDSAVYRDNRAAFWELWLRQALAHPLTYLNAWLMTSYGNWYPDAVIDCYEGNVVYTFTYSESSYFGYETEPPGERESRIPALDAWYEYLSLDVSAQTVPVLHYVLSCGAVFWVFAFLLATLLRRRRYSRLMVYLPILLVWLTVLLGPCTLPRYVVYLWFGLPEFLAEIADDGQV